MAAGQGSSAYQPPSSYSKRDLMNLWTQAGGSPAKAGLAASIALAESSGRVGARNQNTNGTIDRGLWQINSIHGDKSTFDPLANARAAVALSNDGASFHPWVTYNTGAYKKYVGSAGGTPAPQMLRGSAATSMTRTVPGAVTPGGVGVADLLKALQPQRAPVMSAPIAPQFSATSRYLKMGAVPASSGVISSSGKPSVADLLSAVQTTALPVDRKVTTRMSGVTMASGGAPSGKGGVANFEGKQVAAWIAPVLAYARRQGWKGTVQSGYRSFADQTRIYNSGVRPAAKPGTSNHEGTQFPRGAVDVSDAAQLSAIIAKSKYARLLQWAGPKDPVHFSHPHNGSY